MDGAPAPTNASIQTLSADHDMRGYTMKNTPSMNGTFGHNLILVGNSPDSIILGGLLESQRLRGEIWRIGRRTYTGVRRVKSLQVAIDYAKSSQGAVIVVPNPADISLPIVDIGGRDVALMSELLLIEQLLGRIPLDLVQDEEWVDFARSRKKRRSYSMFKRSFDICFAIVAGLVMFPAFGFAALITLLSCGRPIIDKVPCYGLDGSVFRLWQFQTKRRFSGGDNSVATGSRTFRWQRFVYHHHLHVLPSIWNLLVGDISVIGPRVEGVNPTQSTLWNLAHYRYRLLVRPGLVSLAQVRFRYASTLHDTRVALEYDIYYVKYLNTMLDFWIFFRGLSMGMVTLLGFNRDDSEWRWEGRPELQLLVNQQGGQPRL
jgi:lipopolysaccharide/colanic/teichoic acid biosynthesis glycosyltransferase